MLAVSLRWALELAALVYQPFHGIAFHSPSCHSMGSPYFALFLRQHVSPAWQHRHVAGHVSVSGGESRIARASRSSAHSSTDHYSQASVRAGTWAGSLWAPLAVVTGGQDAESRPFSRLTPLQVGPAGRKRGGHAHVQEAQSSCWAEATLGLKGLPAFASASSQGQAALRELLRAVPSLAYLASAPAVFGDQVGPGRTYLWV